MINQTSFLKVFDFWSYLNKLLLHIFSPLHNLKTRTKSLLILHAINIDIKKKRLKGYVG